jgi:hypothetical protein
VAAAGAFWRPGQDAWRHRGAGGSTARVWARGAGGRGTGEKGARAGGYTVLSRSGAARWLADDVRERGRGGRKEEKRSGRLEAPVAERGERRRGRSEPGEGAGGGRRES